MKMSITTRLMIPIILLSLTAAAILGFLTEIRETSHHIDREKEAWINVGNNMVSAWKSTMLFTGSDNLARDQFYKQMNGQIAALSLKRNPQMFKINPESSPFISTDIERRIIKEGNRVSHIEQDKPNRMLLTLIPVTADSECVACHLKLNNHDLVEGDVMAVITLKTPLKQVDALIESDRNVVLIGLVLSILVAVGFIYFSMKRITKPIKILTNAAKKVTSGMIDTQVDITSNDEIGVLAGTFNEMTLELKTLEQSSKLAAIGELAAGVAHEINNPLTNIIGYSKILNREIGSDSKYAEYLEGINEEAQRAHNIISKLLSFAREAPLNVQPSYINDLLDKVISQIDKVTFPPDISLKNQFQENLPEIYIDQNQIQQVFINLINNSFHAMSDGGELFITTFLDEEEDLLNIEFKDTGVGIAEEKIGKVFDPFFTTKDVGKGTGLGLSISYGIIKAHGGGISLESEVGKGTIFTVSLPITNGLEKS